MCGIYAGYVRISDVIGDVIVGVFLIAYVISGIMMIGYKWTEFRRKRKIRTAQKMEIAQGITLKEGAEAYFCGDVHWGADWGKTWNYVDFLAGFWSGQKASIRIHLDTGRMEVLNFRRDRGPEGKNEPEILIDAMVQAAREKRKKQ